VKEAVVSDSTCLIGLERVGKLDLLPTLFSPIFIPPEVQREFGVSLPWLQVDVRFDATLTRALRMQVDGGEAEAICSQSSWDSGSFWTIAAHGRLHAI
jgi:predicted nucleic acid-binding protein